MLKNISNLGTTLSKKDQKSIQGGEFCAIHCIAECYNSIDINDQEALAACNARCQRLSNQHGNGGF